VGIGDLQQRRAITTWLLAWPAPAALTRLRRPLRQPIRRRRLRRRQRIRLQPAPQLRILRLQLLNTRHNQIELPLQLSDSKVTTIHTTDLRVAESRSF